jgi:hypothetical protein
LDYQSGEHWMKNYDSFDNLNTIQKLNLLILPTL